MLNREESEKVVNIIKDYKSSSNSELTFVMDFIQEDFKKSLQIINNGEFEKRNGRTRSRK